MKKGFTLPDVLITLAVFGVFAALVLPPLIEGYQKKAWTSQLRKSYNTLTNALRQMMMAEHIDHLYTEENGFSACDNIWKYIEHDENVIDGVFEMKTLNSESVLPCDTRHFKTYLLNDNSEVSQANEMFIVDVNGHAKPNRFGRDVFIFLADDNGRLLPAGSKFINQINPRTRNLSYCNVHALIDWKSNYTLCGIEKSPKISDGVTGFGCASRVIENNWEMDY